MTKLLTTLTAAIAVCTVAGYALLGNPTQAVADEAELGAEAPAFSLRNVNTGADVSLADFEGKTVVLVFHSTTCPWYRMRDNGGYDRVLIPMAAEYADDDVVFLGINANRTESTENIAEYVTTHESYPVLKDEGNVVADAYGARVTPHVYVINGEGELVYKGAIESRVSNPGACGTSETPYLKPVLDALINGTELPYTDTTSEVKGCSIKRV
ncbi:MAG: redoxin domain-containing protein [Planctomycetota bacterium]